MLRSLVGSEMCIKDRENEELLQRSQQYVTDLSAQHRVPLETKEANAHCCSAHFIHLLCNAEDTHLLLSLIHIDAADELHFVDLGVPGILIHQALQVEVPVAVDAHPNVITVWLAVKDIIQRVPVSSYTQDLDTLVSRLQAAAPSARIAVANVPDLTLLHDFTTYDPVLLQTQISAYDSAIASVVNHHHLILVDIYQRWQAIRQHPEYLWLATSPSFFVSFASALGKRWSPDSTTTTTTADPSGTRTDASSTTSKTKKKHHGKKHEPTSTTNTTPTTTPPPQL